MTIGPPHEGQRGMGRAAGSSVRFASSTNFAWLCTVTIHRTASIDVAQLGLRKRESGTERERESGTGPLLAVWASKKLARLSNIGPVPLPVLLPVPLPASVSRL